MSQFFRASVGAVITNKQGEVLLLERSDTPGAWQFPQGGIDDQEEPLSAALREIEEETGIRPQALSLLHQHPRLVSYELPPEWRSAKLGRGQTQRWFFLLYLADPKAIILPCPGEFQQWRWINFQESLSLVAQFRQEIYRELAREFATITPLSK
ncbi:MAG: RNA pyrophosphohydrolase [Desulfobulbaceae bacterium]|nr:RNA pyrophosphohydrolase [Desulfobulbaceae bacterium]